MTNNIFIESNHGTPTSEKKFEIVERKGIGHPDTICDLIMDQVSIELSKSYINEFGAIQHHNMDKAYLVAGQTENKFGGGNILKPMKLIMGDRATFQVANKKIPIDEISIDTASKWFSQNIKNFQDDSIEFQIEIGQTSKELQSIFSNQNQFSSNDTSCVVGYAPFTPTERLVLSIEEFINSSDFKKEFASSGEDVKVMGFRNQNEIDITIAMAFVDKFVSSENNYFMQKNEMINSLSEFIKKNTDMKFNIRLNALDKKGYGINGTYLTVLGTSADGADSGQVGRGNMANRVISLCRPAGSEATAGKNAVSHIGKIYNAMSFHIAEEIMKKNHEIKEVIVWMYNIIGSPVSNPKAVIINPLMKKEKTLNNNDISIINQVVETNLSNIDNFCNELLSNKIKIV